MNAEYYINKFQEIPDNLWCEHYFVHPENKEVHCALGHCGERLIDQTEEAFGLIKIFASMGKSVRDVNDGTFGNEGLGTTPKQRILKVLKQAKDFGG